MDIIKFLRLICLILAMAALAACSDVPEQYADAEQSEIIYKTVGEVSVGLDILYPTRRLHDKNPTVAVIHGGGWVSGSREDFYRDFEPLIDRLRAGGVTVVGITYRLASEDNSWRVCLEDCEDALAYLLEHADEYDIDTENFGVIGYSAGAQLALMTSIGAGDQVKYCVSMSAPTTFSAQSDSPYYTETLDYYARQAKIIGMSIDQYKASPVILVSRRCATDFLLVNGTADEVVPACHAELFCREAESFGLEVELIEPEGLTHSYPHYAGFEDLCREIADRVIDRLK